MKLRDTLEIFSKKFVKKPYQHRCTHDGLKNPANLMKKICHNISDVFESEYENGVIKFDPSDTCYLFDIIGHLEKTNWGDAISTVRMDGGGYLVIDESGCKFYSVSEGYPPPQQFAGSDS